MKSVYNEKRYLNGDQESLEYIMELRNEHLKQVHEDYEKYYETISNYDLFLDEIVNELLKYKLDNPLEYSIALCYLIDKGYLSIDNKFKHKESNDEINGRLGINVVSGRGCCRNLADFHKDIFDKMNITSKQFYCYEGIGNGINKWANHVINLVEYNDNLYGVDLNNNAILYHLKKPMIMSLISAFNSSKLTYKPYYEIVMGESNLEEIKNNIKMFEIYTKKKAINSLLYDIEIKYRIRDLMKTNKSHLEKFSESTKVLKKIITSNMPNNM